MKGRLAKLNGHFCVIITAENADESLDLLRASGQPKREGYIELLIRPRWPSSVERCGSCVDYAMGMGVMCCTEPLHHMPPDDMEERDPWESCGKWRLNPEAVVPPHVLGYREKDTSGHSDSEGGGQAAPA